MVFMTSEWPSMSSLRDTNLTMTRDTQQTRGVVNVGVMLAHRLRRWANTTPKIRTCLCKHEALPQCWGDVGPSSTTLTQNWANASCLLGRCNRHVRSHTYSEHLPPQSSLLLRSQTDGLTVSRLAAGKMIQGDIRIPTPRT